MDLRKLKKLIDLVEASGISELELTEGEEKVKISRNNETPYQPQLVQSQPQLVQSQPKPNQNEEPKISKKNHKLNLKLISPNFFCLANLKCLNSYKIIKKSFVLLCCVSTN